MIKKIAHVAIATRSIAVMSEFYKALGLEIDAIETVRDQKVKVAMMRVGDSLVELVEALDDDSPIARSIEKRGEGIHHIALEVDDIRRHLEELKAKNIRLIDEEPREGANDCWIAFIHPDSTGGALIELTQKKEGGDAG